MGTQRRKRWAVVGVGVLVVLAIYGGYLYWMRWQVDTLKAAIRAAGEPVTLAEMNARYKTIPPEANAAETYRNAFRAFREPSEIDPNRLSIKNVDLPGALEPLPDDLRQTMARYVEANKDTLALLHQAAAIPQCRYLTDLNGSPRVYDHLLSIDIMSRLLEIDGVFEADRQNAAEAVRAIEDALALGRSLKDEPILASQRYRIRCNGRVFNAFKQTLNRTALTTDQLLALVNDLDQIETPGALTETFVQERCYIPEAFAKYLPEVLAQSTLAGVSLSFPERVVQGAYAATGVKAYDERLWFDFMGKIINASRLPFPHACTMPATISDQYFPRTFILHPMTTSWVASVEQCLEAEQHHVARMRTMRMALAIERFRKVQGNTPRRLEDLVPEYLDQILQDPFDGAPLRCRQTPFSYRVYSIGLNNLDDGGIEEWPVRRDGDVVVEVRTR